ncbi:hypothetical protein L1I30_00050 [Gillisia sp. M10.2A]|uniref:Uncharacterized protein n=1 Tax=Gillisia lutea TaxID=2909668 RepID=A0ABS9ECZ7_9FLAO|nr:hypothetical protein [Gillisia lutea]MCF4100044.1 hypothetical protein [Gillisia lutea]
MTSNIYSQNTLDQTTQRLKELNSVQEILNLKKTKFKDFGIITTFTELDRKIDFGYKHYRILVMPNSGSELKINFVSKDDEIIIGWVSEYSSNKGVLENQIFKADKSFNKYYIKKHNDFYNSNLTIEDFEEQIIQEAVVGFGCGEVGLDIPKESKAMFRWEKNGRINKLNDYLKSFSPELQTLGAIGLLKINDLSKEQTKIINHLKMRNSVIMSCSGCLYGLNDTFNDLIESYE